MMIISIKNFLIVRWYHFRGLIPPSRYIDYPPEVLLEQQKIKERGLYGLERINKPPTTPPTASR